METAAPMAVRRLRRGLAGGRRRARRCVSPYHYHTRRSLCRREARKAARTRRRRRRLTRCLGALLAGLIGVPAAAVAGGLRVEVNLPAYSFRLYDGDEVVLAGPVTIGSPGSPTPVGRWRVRRLTWNPRWMPPPSMDADHARPVPPGPDNPMGVVKLPLTGAIYLHGTDRAGQLGRPASHGCIRLANDDARALAEHLQRRLLGAEAAERIRRRRQASPGEPVTVRLPRPVPVRVRYEPLVLREGGGILHPDVYRRLEDVRGYLRRALARGLEVPATAVSLGAGGLLARLSEGWDRPLRFQLELD